MKKISYQLKTVPGSTSFFNTRLESTLAQRLETATSDSLGNLSMKLAQPPEIKELISPFPSSENLSESTKNYLWICGFLTSAASVVAKRHMDVLLFHGHMSLCKFFWGIKLQIVSSDPQRSTNLQKIKNNLTRPLKKLQ